MTAPVPPPWPCEAYGPGGLEFGYVCFVGGAERWCGSRPECFQTMAAERKRIWSLMTKVGADTDLRAVAAEFDGPEGMLGGDSPIGLWCPECGEPPTLVLMPPDSGAFCANEACRILKWEPTQTHAEMEREGITEIEL
jgi:hypothetical protein